ncbi:MAG: radical SAM protein [Fimbriimonadaceae bacterium]|jgi:pyruvate formate lyase activating enzyme|nr:radical SAM protein [Fimbriimonadaceae bacterium]
MDNELVTGWVFDVHRFSLNDGPGIRTTFFLQGCPLECLWCHNPESQAYPSKMTAHECSKVRELPLNEALAMALSDQAFYRRSGGGVTLSGGEPTVQHRFVSAFLHELGDRGIHRCLDTCGFLARQQLASLVPLVDLFLFDYKATGELHKKLMGQEADLILQNLNFLLDQKAAVWLRCPLVPGVNDQLAHLEKIASLSQRVEKVTILPYHKSGVHKYGESGKVYGLPEATEPSTEQIAVWQQQIADFGGQNVMMG